MTKNEIVSDLKVIENELLYVARSWIIFEESCMKFCPEEEQEYVDKINNLRCGRSYVHLQNVLLWDCTLGISRICEKQKGDRITLELVVHSINTFANSEGIDTVFQQQLVEMTTGRRQLNKCAEWKELQQFRNLVLGHKVRDKRPLAKYQSIPTLIVRISDVLDRACQILGRQNRFHYGALHHEAFSAQNFWNSIS